MKWLRTIILFDKGNIIGAEDWGKVHESYVRAITSIDHPRGTGRLVLRKKERSGKDWKRNGVKYLRGRFLDHMTGTEGWKSEGKVDVAGDHVPPVLKEFPSQAPYQEPITSKFGGFDFVTKGKDGIRVAIEWETGNISSSHRSMNKLAIALNNGVIDVGVLIVPSRALYDHLTDRVGNIHELSGYLEMWHGLGAAIPRGLLAITVVEHDELVVDNTIPFLATGNDGMAKQKRSKLLDGD